MPPSGWKDDVIQTITKDGHRRSWNNTFKYFPNKLRRKIGNASQNSATFYQNSISNRYNPRGRALQGNDDKTLQTTASDNDVDKDPNSLLWEHYYAHKDRREIYDIIHAAFAK